MKRWFLAIVLLVSGMISCCRSNSSLHDPTGIEKERLADDVIHRAATKLKQETNLRPCGTIGQMLNEIQILGLSFYYYQPVDIVEGRKLLLKSVDTMLQEVNKETRIHPYLIRYPFRPRNIEIQIFLFNPDGRDVAPGALCIAEAEQGFFRYKIHNPTGRGLITVYKETYEEALQRLNDPSLPPVSFESNSKISPEELTKLRKNISFVADDGSIWHLGADGCWEKDAKREQ